MVVLGRATCCYNNRLMCCWALHNVWEAFPPVFWCSVCPGMCKTLSAFIFGQKVYPRRWFIHANLHKHRSDNSPSLPRLRLYFLVHRHALKCFYQYTQASYKEGSWYGWLMHLYSTLSHWSLLILSFECLGCMLLPFDPAGISLHLDIIL